MRTNLKVLRVKHGLTQEEMASKTGIARGTYSAIETGARDGSKYFWKSVQKNFGIPDSEMWALQKQDNE